MLAFKPGLAPTNLTNMQMNLYINSKTSGFYLRFSKVCMQNIHRCSVASALPLFSISKERIYVYSLTHSHSIPLIRYWVAGGYSISGDLGHKAGLKHAITLICMSPIPKKAIPSGLNNS